MPKLLKKTLDAMKLVAIGETPANALKLTNNKDTISTAAVSKFNAKVRKYSLTKPDIVKKARDQVKRILSGENREITKRTVDKEGNIVEYQEVIPLTDTNIIAACSMVYERFEPVKGTQEPGTVNNTYVDLSNYQVQINPKAVSCHDNLDNNYDNNKTLQAIDIVESDK